MRFLRVTLAPELLSMDDSTPRVTLLASRYLSDGTVVELSRVEGDRDEVVAGFEANRATIDYELAPDDGGQRVVYHHLRPDEGDPARLLLSLLDAHRLVIRFPVRFDARTGATVDLAGPTDEVQAAYDRLPAEVRRHTTIERVSEDAPPLVGLRADLTDRQREVLDAAVELGYYAVPRRATAEDVAAEVGCAPSTASEHLRKIEARVLTALAT